MPPSPGSYNSHGGGAMGPPPSHHPGMPPPPPPTSTPTHDMGPAPGPPGPPGPHESGMTTTPGKTLLIFLMKSDDRFR